MVGKTVGHYRILDKLGEGGMGVVYKAEDTKLDRLVALKFLPQHLTANKIDRERFVREAKAASAINHPNVCVIHDIQEHENQQFIVMEFVDGMTLRRTLEGVPLETKEVVDFAVQIAEALAAAHGKGIIHRDVKSDNIMITEAHRIKVMDFGLAKLKGSVRITKTSTTVGTLAYMSPEQIQGKDVDARSDIFSFGVLLYEMLAGRLPFQAEFESALMYAIINEDPEPIESLRAGVPSELVHVVNRALEKDPADRYQAVNDMLVDLRRVKRVSDRVSRVSTTGTAARPSTNAGGDTATHEPAAVRGRGRVHSIRRRALWMTAVLIGVAAAVFAILKLSKSDKAPSFERMQMTRLTTSGNAKDAVISADGRYVVHVLAEEGKESLWIKQVATNSDVQVLAPAEVQFLGLTFSPDGNYVYYVAADKMGLGGALYRMPVLGGAATKVMDDIYGPVTFSPDGERFAFVRGSWKTGKTALVVSNKDGTGQKELAVRNLPDLFTKESPSWSPDGEVIICGDIHYAPGELPSGVAAVKVEDGTEERATSKRWGSFDCTAWLRDGSGFLGPASDQSTGWFRQIWFVSYPEGVDRRITHDLNNYMGVSLTEDSRTLVTVQNDRLSTIWIVEPGDPRNARQITFGKFDGFYGVAWTPDGRIVYGSRDLDIWVTGSDGGNRQVLTVGEHNSADPAVSPDGRSIVFESWRSLDAQSLWVMDIDGGNPKRLTFGVDDFYPAWSPDGQWVVYRSLASGNPSVWKVPMDGGAPMALTNSVSDQPAVSPDGKLVACFYEGDPKALGERRIAILPFEGGEPLKTFDIPPGTSRDAWLRWTPDGRAVTYAVDRGRVSNIWAQQLDGGGPTRLTEFETLRILAFDWSKDGRLVCARGAVDNDVVLMRFE